jgi:hypothetical protein
LHDEKERKTWMFVNPVGLGALDPLFTDVGHPLGSRSSRRGRSTTPWSCSYDEPATR